MPSYEFICKKCDKPFTLDMTISELMKGVIDFNLCYNPYCAYNNRFSCPIPPQENHLEVQVLAGAKKWHD